MKILLLGADGFLGQALAEALGAVGHIIVRGVHHPRQGSDLAIDYRCDLAPQDWRQRLQGIDAVVNAVGILRERQAQDFERIHHLAPAALFAACAQAGVKKIVQISALGTGDTPYLHSKRAADAALLQACPHNAVILRPGLVFGAHGVSTRFFLGLACLPVHFVPRGIGALQPVHLDDVVLAVRNALAEADRPSRIVELPGARALEYGAWLTAYRQLCGLPQAPQIPVPAWLMAALARVAGIFPGSMLSRDTWTMLVNGNCADTRHAAELLGRPLTDPARFAAPEEAESLRLAALARWRRPLLLGVLAALWLLSALVSACFPRPESLALLAPFGLDGPAAQTVLWSAIALDLLMGALTLCCPCRRLWWTQLALVLLYSALIAWVLPVWLLHPFGPVLKNLAVLALLWLLLSEETRL